MLSVPAVSGMSSSPSPAFSGIGSTFKRTKRWVKNTVTPFALTCATLQAPVHEGLRQLNQREVAAAKADVTDTMIVHSLSVKRQEVLDTLAKTEGKGHPKTGEPRVTPDPAMLEKVDRMSRAESAQQAYDGNRWASGILGGLGLAGFGLRAWLRRPKLDLTIKKP